MTSFKDMEDNLKSFLIQEQSDAHNIKTLSAAKYNNLKIWIDLAKYVQPHIFIHLAISEAVFSLDDASKIYGGLGYEERFVQKWLSRMGVRDKLMTLWRTAETNRGRTYKSEVRGSDVV